MCIPDHNLVADVRLRVIWRIKPQPVVTGVDTPIRNK